MTPSIDMNSDTISFAPQSLLYLFTCDAQQRPKRPVVTVSEERQRKQHLHDPEQ
jgi:hypothetical protein